MEIKERVYALVPGENFKGFRLDCDNEKLYCPKTVFKCVCGTWCPAFEILSAFSGERDTLKSYYKVRLNCFPQKIEFEIKEV